MTSSLTKGFFYDWSWLLPAEPEALWPLVSDTDRFNRDAGLPPVRDARAPGEELENARHKIRIRVKGVLLEWEELPFEWFRPWRFGVVRRYSRGPLVEMRVQAELQEAGGGMTRLRYQVAAYPRGLFGLVTTPLQIGLISRYTFGRTFLRYARTAARSQGGGVESPGVPTPDASRLAARLTAADVDPEAAAMLGRHLVSADDMTLGRIRPYELADRHGLSRRSLLTTCLRATRAGVLDLSWDILCPSCKGTAASADTLRNLKLGATHCDTCRIDFSPTFDQAVELTFHPNPSVRRVETAPFCVAGPQVTPHVEVQQLLAPGETRVVRPRLSRGRHRLRCLGTTGGPSFLVEPGGADAVTVSAGPDGWGETPLTVAPDATVTLVNAHPHESLLCVERTSWGDTAVTAAEVTALPEFRDLFSSEVLAEGAFAHVGSLAVLFTDLRDSTAMYARVGDAKAFGQVMRHFDILQARVAAGGGTVVKTIGDAVMAVFPSMANAVEAALDAQAELAHPPGGGPPMTLKAGVHFGPTIAVTLNDRLDYFGTTVNVAARLGGLSSGHDLVVSQRVRADAEVQRLLETRGATVASATSDIRGLQERLPTWRISIPAEGGR